MAERKENMTAGACGLQLVPYQKLLDLHLLAHGGFGSVFRARHADWLTHVAVKCLSLDGTTSVRERTVLLREAEMMQRARFSHIIPILGVCEDPEFVAIVMEYMPNGSLDALLHQPWNVPCVPWPLRIRMLHEMALAMNYLHSLTPPLLHHDLKSHNVLLDGDFHTKIADFGLARWRKQSQFSSVRSNPTALGAGTVLYMPPEAFNSEKRTDASHDVYSFGIIMWEVLSRKRPFEEAVELLQVMFSVQFGTRPPLEAVPAEVPNREFFVDLTHRCWAQEPQDRPTFSNCAMGLEKMLSLYEPIELICAVSELMQKQELSNSLPDSSQELQEDPCTAFHKLTLPNALLKATKVDLTTPTMESNPPIPVSSNSSNVFCSPEASVCNLKAVKGVVPFTDTVSVLEHKCDVTVQKGGDGMIYRENDVNFVPEKAFLTSYPHCTSTVTRDGVENQNQNATLLMGSGEQHLDWTSGQTFQAPTMPFQTARMDGDLDVEMKCPVSESDVSAPFEDALPEVCLWMVQKRETLVAQMTDASLNQVLDGLMARNLLIQEDYELVTSKATRSGRVRFLFDVLAPWGPTRKSAAELIVQKLIHNRQNGLEPFPELDKSV
uniref:receptor-interacting serine/threonine-protein kinase 2 n=1 Tax=Myxine glutinosa TaxID=7769 RepID=UPI00358E86D8